MGPRDRDEERAREALEEKVREVQARTERERIERHEQPRDVPEPRTQGEPPERRGERRERWARR